DAGTDTNSAWLASNTPQQIANATKDRRDTEAIENLRQWEMQGRSFGFNTRTARAGCECDECGRPGRLQAPRRRRKSTAGRRRRTAGRVSSTCTRRPTWKVRAHPGKGARGAPLRLGMRAMGLSRVHNSVP